MHRWVYTIPVAQSVVHMLIWFCVLPITLEQVCIWHNCCADVYLTYLLYRCVFDSLRVVIVIDDVKVFDGRGEWNIQRCFPSSFSQHCEVSGFTALYTWTGRRKERDLNGNSQIWKQTFSFIHCVLVCLTRASQSRTLCFNFRCIMGRIDFNLEGALWNFLCEDTDVEIRQCKTQTCLLGSEIKP